MSMHNRPKGPRGFLTEEEKKNKPKITFGVIKRILSYLLPYWPQFAAVFILIFISSALGLLPSVITGKIVDEALTGSDMNRLIKLLAAAFVTLTGAQIISLLENYINAWISQRIIFDMKNEMYLHLQYMPHSFFTGEKQGDIITRMNSDIDGVSSVISGTLTSVVSNVCVAATTLTALFTMNRILAVVGIIVLPLLIMPARSAGRTRWKLAGEGQKSRDKMNELVNETLSVSGSMLVKLFCGEKKEYDKFVETNREVTKYALREQRSGKLFHLVMGMFTQIGPLMIYFAGGYLIISRLDASLTVGTVTATVALVNRLYRPVESLLNIQVDITRSMALFTRIFDYLDRKSGIVSKEGALTPDISNGDIRFENVCFSYTKDVPVLKNISFIVPKGAMYAIVGPSGSGKSTITNLIPRLYDADSGSVSIAGVNVKDFELSYLRECIGVVTQEAYLFNGTIKENLLYAKDNACMKEVENACKAANIHEFIVNSPDKYDTIVGNRGLKLSGGEKQRIAIARVILKNPRILILDEATSALDSINESNIQDALEAVMKGRTSIVIAHRLSTVMAADNILVVDEGKIVEQGRHEELLKNNGLYRRLYETQFRHVL